MAMPFGNARFASAEEVRAHGLLTADSGAMPLGFLIENGELTGQPVGNPLRQNAVLIGPSGSGKTTRVFIPFALHGRGERSVIWVDPKGDIGAVAGRLRAKVGSFYSINPRGVLADRPGYEDLKSCGFNVLKSLRSASPSFDADVGGLAEALIPMAGEQPFWPLMARALVSGLIMGEVIDAEAHACRPSLSRVRDELADVERLPQRLAELAHYRHRGLRNKVRPLLQKARSVMDVISTAASETEFLDDPEIAADLATDGGLDFASLRERPTTVCITVPAGTMERDSKWLRLTLSAALRDLMQAPEAGQLPVTIILDEYFLIANGGLKIIEQAWAFVRGFGIQLLVALQDLPQLQDLYPPPLVDVPRQCRRYHGARPERTDHGRVDVEARGRHHGHRPVSKRRRHAGSRMGRQEHGARQYRPQRRRELQPNTGALPQRRRSLRYARRSTLRLEEGPRQHDRHLRADLRGSVACSWPAQGGAAQPVFHQQIRRADHGRHGESVAVSARSEEAWSDLG